MIEVLLIVINFLLFQQHYIFRDGFRDVKADLNDFLKADTKFPVFSRQTFFAFAYKKKNKIFKILIDML